MINCSNKIFVLFLALFWSCGESSLAGDTEAIDNNIEPTEIDYIEEDENVTEIDSFDLDFNGEDSDIYEETASALPYSTFYPFSNIKIMATEIAYQSSTIEAKFGNLVIPKMEVEYDVGECRVIYYQKCEPGCNHELGEWCTTESECVTFLSGQWEVGLVEIKGASGMDLISLNWHDDSLSYTFDRDAVIFASNDLLEIEIEGDLSFDNFKETIVFPEFLSDIDIPSSIEDDPYTVQWDPADGELIVFEIVSFTGNAPEKQALCVSVDDGVIEVPQDVLNHFAESDLYLKFLRRLNFKEFYIGSEKLRIDVLSYGH